MVNSLKYTHVCIYPQTYTRTNINTCIHIDTDRRIYTHRDIDTHVCIYTDMYRHYTHRLATATGIVDADINQNGGNHQI